MEHLMTWEEVEPPILNYGPYWTTKDRDPSPAQIKRILELSEGQANICRRFKRIMQFDNYKFVGSGKIFYMPEDIPPYAPPRTVAIMFFARKLDSFSTEEMAKLVFGARFHGGKRKSAQVDAQELLLSLHEEGELLRLGPSQWALDKEET